jgi:hypothetical protein
MHFASEDDTRRFLQGLWFEWGSRLIRTISKEYTLSDEQTDALLTILLRPNDWILHVGD